MTPEGDRRKRSDRGVNARRHQARRPAVGTSRRCWRPRQRSGWGLIDRDGITSLAGGGVRLLSGPGGTPMRNGWMSASSWPGSSARGGQRNRTSVYPSASLGERVSIARLKVQLRVRYWMRSERRAWDVAVAHGAHPRPHGSAL
jgi:hypothetical protein